MNDLPATHSQQMRMARTALEGLSIGDAFGGFFEGRTGSEEPWHLKKRQLPPDPWRWTDDTLMALSIYEVLRRFGHINQDALAASFAHRYDHTRGYGMGARHMVNKIEAGEDWRTASKAMFNNEGSLGNGGAMRAPVVGAYYAESDTETLIAEAARSAEITHAHPEGIAGAVAVALATAYAWEAGKTGHNPGHGELLEAVIPHLQDSAVKEGCITARDASPKLSIRDAAERLGNGSLVTAPDTVPFALYCAGRYLHDYEEAIWNTARGLGDVDTNLAIVGGIVAMFVGVLEFPRGWKNLREPLPMWALEDVEEDE